MGKQVFCHIPESKVSSYITVTWQDNNSKFTSFLLLPPAFFTEISWCGTSLWSAVLAVSHPDLMCTHSPRWWGAWQVEKALMLCMGCSATAETFLLSTLFWWQIQNSTLQTAMKRINWVSVKARTASKHHLVQKSDDCREALATLEPTREWGSKGSAIHDFPENLGHTQLDY